MNNALILNAIVLVVVLEADLGWHRKIGWFRLVRPFVTAGAAAAFFARGVTTSGTGLELEIGLTALGVVLGLVAASLMSVHRSPRTGRLVSRAGAGYAALWVVVVAARAAFSWGAVHWFAHPLGRWMTVHHVTSAALTDALIFMAVAMLVVRTAGLAAKAHRVAQDDLVEVSA